MMGPGYEPLLDFWYIYIYICTKIPGYLSILTAHGMDCRDLFPGTFMISVMRLSQEAFRSLGALQAEGVRK